MDTSTLIHDLLDNSKAAIIGAVELHNKPIFPYRYEITVVLTINAWELAFKAYILQNHPEIKVIRADGTTKPFEECLGFLEQALGKDFLPIKESIERLYEYRCNIIHFYGGEIELILYSILRPNILYYADFINEHFAIDLADEVNLVLLPIGFKRTISPIDFLSSKSVESSEAVQVFIKNIVKSTENLIANNIQDSIIMDYRMSLINEKRIKNADIIVGITKDPTQATIMVNNLISVGSLTNDETASTVRIDEDTVFKTIYIYDTRNMMEWAKSNIKDFVANQNFKNIRKSLQENANYYRVRYVNVLNPKYGKGFYSEAGLNKLKEEYEKIIDSRYDDF
jgi:Protein of unknown function (DUF3644)/EC042_2821-lke REase